MTGKRDDSLDPETTDTAGSPGATEGDQTLIGHPRVRARLRTVGASVPIDRRDRRWLALAVLPGLVAVAIYLATNAYPASGAGLYTKIASEIVANGYLPPAEVPGYTVDGVPFAYPPLQLYLLAALLDVGLDPLVVTRILPGVAVVLSLVPVYLLASDVVESRAVGAVAAAAVALNPQILQWHVTAGGTVRAFAFLYAMTAIYAGYHVFDGGSRRAIATGLVAFGLTLLAHPTYALFVVVTYLLFWAVADRSLPGLARGAAVGIGGSLLAGPWLAWVATTHGIGTFGAAAGTHGGVGGGIFGGISMYVVVPLLAAGFLAYRRRFLLPVWLLAAEVLFAQPRFAFTVGSITVPAAGYVFLRERGWLADLDVSLTGTSPISHGSIPVDARTAGTVLLVLVGTVVGGAYLAHEMSLTTDPSTPEYVDEDDVAAMEWIAAETEADATFVVLGDAAEWFPALTDRTILVGHWGLEWVDPAAFERQIDAFERVSACRSVACIAAVTDDVGHDPDYVYVPKGQYTIRGEYTAQFGTLERSFAADPGWERSYDGDGAAIYRHVGDERAD